MIPWKGGQSPWGTIQGLEEIAPGVLFASTASHGGVWLSPDKLAEMPTALKARSTFYHGGHWFEEDCEILRVVVAFPHLFKTPKDEALDMLCKMNTAVREAVAKTGVGS